MTEVANLSFDPSNLWTLHQYYFSPSTQTATTNDSYNNNNNNETMEIEIKKHKHSNCDDDDSDNISRPSKRPSNRLTMTRIAAYPRIKVYIISLFYYFLSSI